MTLMLAQDDTTTRNVGKDSNHVTPIGPSQVPPSKRILQILCAVTYSLLSAGIVFGYAALKPVLIAEGVYRDRCTPAEIEGGVRVCSQQEMKLNLMFTIAAVATNACALVVGTILDRYGPRIAGFIGSGFLVLGCVGFGVSKSVRVVDPYPISYLLIALAGPFIYIPSMTLANAFPRRSGLILALMTGAFDSSPAIFLVYRLLYQSTLGPISLRNWFIAFLIVPLFIFLVQLFVMPAQSYRATSELEIRTEVEHEVIRGERRVASEDRRVRSESMGSETDTLFGNHSTDVEARNKGVYGAMHGKDIKSQLSSFWFWGITGFTVVQMLRINYFVATIRPQYEFLLHSYEASVAINGFFDVALPLGGVIAIPFIGTYLDTFSIPTIISTLVVCTTSIGLLGLVQDSYAAAYLNILIFVIYRPFYYTVVSAYCAKVFGVATFGKVYGAVICISGFFNFSQAVLDTVTFEWYGGDPRPANTLLLVLGFVVGIALVVYVKAKCNEAKNDDKGHVTDQIDGHNGYGSTS
ncbi:MFS general substrate transporter [Macrolepiota fuliginosa MF-IS2]|uniref:MFS general substrate transporter n=1 Tax=Macrolepiota fuliginosa MF-IS2 TaxID=1400762 RepID=A0A9P6C858_9AGAR|nr:MFS general substrate transporter [Macrolepiota fuliginosa MF-IS2]